MQYVIAVTNPTGSVWKWLLALILLEIAAAVLLLASGYEPIPISWLLVAVALTFGNLVLLHLVNMPRGFRPPLILALLAVTLMLSARTPTFGLVQPAATLEEANEQMGEGIQSAHRNAPSRASRGARVAVTGFAPGWDLDRLDGAWGGSAAIDYTIFVTVMPREEAVVEGLSLFWSIGKGKDKRRCGMLTVIGKNKDEALRQLAFTFQRALQKSVNAREPRCY